jgi:hypothetical protein
MIFYYLWINPYRFIWIMIMDWIYNKMPKSVYVNYKINKKQSCNSFRFHQYTFHANLQGYAVLKCDISSIHKRIILQY